MIENKRQVEVQKEMAFSSYSQVVFMGLALCCFVANSVSAANWPQWRGPDGNGVVTDPQVVTQWSTTKNVAWKSPIPGIGHSSAIVLDDDVFVTTAIPEKNQRLLIRIDARSGRIIWKKVVLTAPLEDMHRENSHASSTPVTDGRFVYTSFQEGTRVNLKCFDFDGNQIWEAKPLSFEAMHGYSYTPILYQNLVILDCCQNDEAALIALDKSTGKLKWRRDNPNTEISHVTPLVIRSAGRDQLIACGSERIEGLDPLTGKLIWHADGPTQVCVAGLAFGDDLVFASGGYPKRSRMAVQTTGQGDVTNSHVAWTSNRAVSYVPSPVFHDGHFYSILDGGEIYCIEAKTGTTVWEHRIKGRYRSSLLLINGNLYITNDQGMTTVFEATTGGFREVAVNDLEEFCYTTPAVSQGRLFIRTKSLLYCIGKE
jgi:hypothetical protein